MGYEKDDFKARLVLRLAYLVALCTPASLHPTKKGSWHFFLSGCLLLHYFAARGFGLACEKFWFPSCISNETLGVIFAARKYLWEWGGVSERLL